MGYVEGADRNQILLLPESVEEYISAENPVRVIDAYVDSLDLREMNFSKSETKSTGRPPYSPHDLLKLYVYGYMNKVRSSRRLEAETKRNLEVIWLMKKLSPDHKTIARFRHDNAMVLKEVFRDFVKLCMKLNLYGKELVAIDGSKFRAVNSKDRNFNQEKLRERIARLDTRIAEYISELDAADNAEAVSEQAKTSDEIKDLVAELKTRRQTYQSYMDELKENGETQKSLTDPDSRRMMSNGKTEVCYNVQSAVDSKNRMIVDFDVTNSAQDHHYLSSMAISSADALGVESIKAAADNGYASGTDAAVCLMNGIIPHIAGMDSDICLPVASEDGNADTVQKITKQHNGRCVYLADRNIAICPMGNILYPGSYKKRNSSARFYNGKACAACLCKCTESRYKDFEIRMPKSAFSKVYNDKDLIIKQVRVTANKDIIRKRKTIVEHPFGTIKRSMDAGYLLTKRLPNVAGEFSITFLAYNIKRAINILGSKRLLEAIET